MTISDVILQDLSILFFRQVLSLAWLYMWFTETFSPAPIFVRGTEHIVSSSPPPHPQACEWTGWSPHKLSELITHNVLGLRVGPAPARTGGSGLSQLGCHRPLEACFCPCRVAVEADFCFLEGSAPPNVQGPESHTELCLQRSRAHYEISAEVGLSSEASSE